MGVDLYAGTVGWGIWRSDDLGESWRFAFEGLPVEIRVWSLSSHIAQPEIVWAGTDIGLLRQGADGHAEHVPSPADGKQVWALTQLPDDPDTLLMGTNPGALFRSSDGGKHWRALPINLVDEYPIGKPRITRIRIDPMDEATIWVSAEIDAVHVSRNGGESWDRSEQGFKFPDIHDIAIGQVNGGRRLLAATALGLYRSADDGTSWDWQQLDSPWQYTRGIKPRADDSGTVFLCNGNGPPGSEGRLLRSRDWGDSWEDAGLPDNPNSTPWMVATHESDPNLLFCCTNLGQMYRSTDGGEAWVKLRREFGEIRTMLWHPAVT